MSENTPQSESQHPSAAAKEPQPERSETGSQMLGETQAFQKEPLERSERTGPKPADFFAPPQAADELGRLGNYRILKELGAGGMGLVLLAEDLQLRRQVALKVMAPALAADETARQRFLREARATAALHHDHVVTIYQVAEDRGVPFLAMELLAGEPLEARLQRQGRPPLAEALRLGREIALGLDAAHEQQLIHRDIKPANIWLEARRGQPSRVKILDFGLAHFERGDERLTHSGMVVGTPQYMSPEQAGGDSVDHRGDLFSLGCVLYRMTTGKPPFEGTNLRSTLKAVMFEAPPPPLTLAPDVPPALGALIERLLAKEPKDRPQSAAEVMEALAALETQLAAKPQAPAAATIEYSRRDLSTGTLPAQDTMTGPRPNRARRRVFARVIGLVVLGLVSLWLGSAIYDHFKPAPNPNPTDAGIPAVATGPFVILARDGSPEKTVAALADAVAAAKTGDTIEIKADGPPITRPIKIVGKALTIRAAPGAAPTLLLKREAAKDPAVNIETDSPLILEGLAFHASDPSPEGPFYYLLVSHAAPLHVAHCRFVVEMPRSHTVLWARESPRCEVRNCQATLTRQDAAFLNFNYSSKSQLLLDNNVFAGPPPAHAVVLVPVGNAKEAIFKLTNNSMALITTVLLLYEPGAPAIENKADRSVRLDARENVFAAHAMTFGQEHDKPTATGAEAEALLKRLVAWREQRNAYFGFYLHLGRRLGDAIKLTKELNTSKSWEEFWGIGDTGSVQGPIQFQGGDLTKKATESPAALVPADFRLAEGSIGKGARAGGKDLGADVDLVGPGPAYERWKKTPEYQQWLQDAQPGP